MNSAAAALDVSDPKSADRFGTDLQQTTTQLVQQIPAAPLITDTTSLAQAVEHRSRLGEAIKQVQTFFEQPKQLAFQLHRALCSRENVLLLPLRGADQRIAHAISAFKIEQDRIRLEAEHQEALRRKREEETTATAEAAHLESAGQPELAAAILEQATHAPLPAVALPDVTKGISGLKFVTRWKWRFVGGPVDVDATPAAVRERALALVPREYLTLDTVKVNAHVRSHKGGGAIPGIQIYSVDEPVR